MNTLVWSAVLQWSRVAMNAAVFLIAARFLTLVEIGVFATAFAPVQIIQAVQRSGFADSGILSSRDPSRLNTFAFISFASGVVLAVLVFALSLRVPAPVSSMMQALSVIPLMNGLALPSEASLRRQFRIRTLALRTLAAQLLAACTALWLFQIGFGLWCLAAFVLANAAIGALLSMALGRIWPRSLPKLSHLATKFPTIGRLAARDLANNATLPVLQFALGLCLGLPAAGAFQIASRFLTLIDAVAISPIRFLVLPKLADSVSSENLAHRTLTLLRQTATAAFLVYPCAIIAGPDILRTVIGDLNGNTASQLLPYFCLLGLMNSVAMPLNQALVASGHAGVTLARAISTLIISLTFALPGLTSSVLAVTAALPLATGIVLVFFVAKALVVLPFRYSELRVAVAAPCLFGVTAVVATGVGLGLFPDLPPLFRLTVNILGVSAIYAGLMTLAHVQTRPMPG